MCSYGHFSGFDFFTWAEHCDPLAKISGFYLFSSNFKFGTNAPRQ